MVRWRVWFPVLVLILVSCGRPAYLVTDAPFRQAFPEVTAAWQSLSPWHDARRLDLPDGTAIEPSIAGLPTGSAVLLGAALTDADRAHLASAHPSVRFFGPPQGTSLALSVDPVAARKLVVEAVPAQGRTAWILLPVQAAPEEEASLTAAWTSRRGSGAHVVRWPTTETPPTDAVVFDFAGPTADNLVAGLAEGRALNGDPGLPLGAAGPGTVWKLSATGLAEALWNAAEKSSKNPEFLPLETGLASR